MQETFLNYTVYILWPIVPLAGDRRSNKIVVHIVDWIIIIDLQGYIYIYHIIHISYLCDSRDCMGVNGEASQLHAVYKKPYYLLQATRESVSVLQLK